MIRSNVTEALAQLATLPEFGSVPTHSGAPPAGTRTYPTAQDGAEFRAIEHAFAVPGYRNHRQAQRRELTTGLSYDVIARAFQKYDAAFTPEHLAHLDLALQIASTPGGSYQQAFTELFQHGGLVIGEAHSLPDAFQFVTRHMADMKAAGMTRLVCEAFPQEFQEELDRFVFGADGIMDGALEDWVRVKDLNRAPLRSPRCHALSDLLCAARKNQVSVIAAEHSAAYLSFGAGRIADPDAAELYDQEKRNGLYNWVAINRKPGNNTTIVPSVDVHITGAAHANTTENGCPGIAQLAGYAAVCVARRDDRSLFLERAREDRSMRPTGIPAHTAISPTSTVAAHPQHKTQRARSLTL